MLERVQKIISNAGFCSRRRAEYFIEQDRVRVNRKKITIGDKADPDKDKIYVDGKLIHSRDKVYLALWKPKKVVTTLWDPKGRKNVGDMVKKVGQRVYPIGRLDNMAEGLLLMTNDGDFANKIMHPRYKIKKKYLVKITDELRPIDLEKLKKGIILDGTKVRPDRVIDLGDRLYEITLHQGLNRVIKRLFEYLGYRVYGLMRIQIGDVKLEGMKRGQYRDLTQEELDTFSV